MGKHVDLSYKEERLLRTLHAKIQQEFQKPIDATATELRIAQHTVYTTLHRLRRRYNAALQFGSKYRSWRKKLGDRYL